MVHAENQVRNFYFVKAKSDSLNNVGDVSVVKSADGKKAIIKYKDHGGKIGTDVILIDNIRDVRLSAPAGLSLYKFVFSGVATHKGDDVIFDINFTNVFGFSDKEQYHRTYTVKAQADNDDVVARLLEMLYNIKSNTGNKVDSIFWSVFDVVYENGAYSLVQANQEFDAVRGLMPHEVKVDIKVKGAPITVSKEVYIYKPNGFKVADMEYAQSKVRADLYGYMGYPDINPTKMVCDDIEKNYVFLDIKYYKGLNGINVQKSEKELTLVCLSQSVLKDVLDALGLDAEVISADGTWSDDNFTYGFINSQADLDKLSWMLEEYWAGGGTGNKDGWNGDGWLVALYNKKPGAGKTVDGTYDGNALGWDLTTTANSTFIIASVTDPNDGIGVSPASAFDPSKLVVSIS